MTDSKFEGEQPATEYFYTEHLGQGEMIFASQFVPDSDIDAALDMIGDGEPCAELFQIDGDEAEAFGLECGAWFLLREDSQGFAYGSVHATREAAEQEFRDWLGL